MQRAQSLTKSANRLILNDAGQIGPEAFNSQFMIETDPKENHLKFRNH